MTVRYPLPVVLPVVATLLALAAAPCQNRSGQDRSGQNRSGQDRSGQDREGMERLAVRVQSSISGGRVVIDRGRRDFLEKGDVVTLRPPGRPEYEGVVTDVDDRSALVQLKNRRFAAAPGIPGYVWIPKTRGGEDPKTGVDKPKPKPPPQRLPDLPPEKPIQPPRRRPEFRNRDEKWRPGMPLLGRGRPIRPAERPTRVSGRIYSMGRYANTARNSDTDSFFRLGTDLDIENPLGRGGGMRFDAEINYRTELTGRDGTDLLLRQFSYYSGGTRFDNTGFEVGRFVQRGMPEFQVLDGIEWGARRKNGHRYGVSAGFLPQPDEDYDSGKDFQLAAYYDWVAGEREQLTISGGLQKTWHNGDNDRDLLIAKVRYLPVDGWDFHSTVWVDYYDGSEPVQNAGFEITQAYATLSRRFANDNSVDLTYRRVRFPDIQRYEFLPPLQQHLADNRYDRISLTTWLAMTEESRFHNDVGFWEDEEDSGGNAQAGIEWREVWLRQDRLDITAFATLGQATTGGGGRVNYSVHGKKGRWDVMYEYAFHHHRGFPDDRDDLVQHLLRVGRSFYTPTGWDITIRGDGISYDDELSWALDFYLQKSF